MNISWSHLRARQCPSTEEDEDIRDEDGIRAKEQYATILSGDETGEAANLMLLFVTPFKKMGVLR